MKRRRCQRGYALMMTLIVVAVLSALALTMSMRVSANVHAAGYQEDEAQAWAGARGAFFRVAAELVPKQSVDSQSDHDRIAGKHLGWYVVDPATWTVRHLEKKPATPPAGILCEVTAEDAKAPLARLDEASLSQVPSLDPVLAAAVANFLKQLGVTGGLRDIARVWQVEGMTAEAFYGTKDKPGLAVLTTAFSRQRVYVNGARRETLRLIPGVDDGVAKEIATQLAAGNTFDDVADLQHVLGVTPAIYESLKDWVTVAPVYHRIAVRGDVAGVPATVQGVVGLTANGVELCWLEGG